MKYQVCVFGLYIVFGDEYGKVIDITYKGVWHGRIGNSVTKYTIFNAQFVLPLLGFSVLAYFVMRFEL